MITLVGLSRLIVVGIVAMVFVSGASGATEVPVQVGQSVRFEAPGLSCSNRSAKALNAWFKGDPSFRRAAVVCGPIGDARIVFSDDSARLYWKEGSWKSMKWPLPALRTYSGLKLTRPSLLKPGVTRQLTLDQTATFQGAGVACSLTLQESRIDSGAQLPTVRCGDVIGGSCRYGFALQRLPEGLFVETDRSNGPSVGEGYGRAGFTSVVYSPWDLPCG